jgi:hypothetical protein
VGLVGQRSLTDDEVATLVARSRAAQGLTPTIKDVDALDRVARVLARPHEAGAA